MVFNRLFNSLLQVFIYLLTLIILFKKKINRLNKREHLPWRQKPFIKASKTGVKRGEMNNVELKTNREKWIISLDKWIFGLIFVTQYNSNPKTF